MFSMQKNSIYILNTLYCNNVLKHIGIQKYNNQTNWTNFFFTTHNFHPAPRL